MRDSIYVICPDSKRGFFKLNGRMWEFISNMPYLFCSGCVVLYHNEIHILGGSEYNLDSFINHFRWNGSEWTEVSTLPYDFINGSAVVYNNEIHIFGGICGIYKHYKWDGSEWTEASRLPYGFYYGSAVVYNNEIHILGSDDNDTKHFKWNGSTWTEASTLPYNFSHGSAVVYNNEIHILGGYNGGIYTNHYKWNGSTWTSVSTLPHMFAYGSAIVHNNEIHIFGAGCYSGTFHCKWSDIESIWEDDISSDRPWYGDEVKAIVKCDDNSITENFFDDDIDTSLLTDREKDIYLAGYRKGINELTDFRKTILKAIDEYKYHKEE